MMFIRAVILATLSYLSHHTFYQFTTYKIVAQGESKNMALVSKVNSRMRCSGSAICKRNLNTDWVVTDSFCADGKDQVNQFIKHDYHFSSGNASLRGALATKQSRF